MLFINQFNHDIIMCLFVCDCMTVPTHVLLLMHLQKHGLQSNSSYSFENLDRPAGI